MRTHPPCSTKAKVPLSSCCSLNARQPVFKTYRESVEADSRRDDEFSLERFGRSASFSSATSLEISRTLEFRHVNLVRSPASSVAKDRFF
ncbi:unnamed protein product, partial [Scytosiphon promiscuus]